MDSNINITLLKCDLQILNTAQDEYLKHLLEMAEELIQGEGIKKEESVKYTGIIVQYAAYLFRKRAGKETSMPRYLRLELNNLLFSQKAGENNDAR